MKEILVWGIITDIAAIVWKIVKFIVINGVIGLFVWLLWNWLMTAAFGLPALDYIQVVGILVIYI